MKPSIVTRSLTALAILCCCLPQTTAKDEVRPADWLAAPMSWLIDHSPLSTDSAAYKAGPDSTDAYMTEWVLEPETQKLLVRLVSVRNGCPRETLWSMSTAVSLPTEVARIDPSDFVAADRDRTQTLANRRIVDAQGSTALDARAWVYRGGDDTPSVQPERRSDGSWLLRQNIEWRGPARDLSVAACGIDRR